MSSSSSINRSTNATTTTTTTTPSYYHKAADSDGVVIPPGGEEDDHNLMDEEALPVRAQHRAIRSTPDPEEPSFSDEETMSHWIMVEKTGSMEEDFDGRLRNGPRRQSGGGSGSFWRTTSSDAGSPSSHSVCTHPRGKSSFTENGALDSMKSSAGSSSSSSLLSVPIAEHEKNSNTNGNNSRSSSATRIAIQVVDMRRDSSLSIGTSNGRDVSEIKEKDRLAELRRKFEAQESDLVIGHIADHHGTNENNDADAEETETDDVFMEEQTVALPAFSQKISMAPVVSFKDLGLRGTTLDRSSSDQSTASLLYCKTPSTDGGANFGVSGMLGNASLGKSSSLILPTGVDAVSGDDLGLQDSTDAKRKRSNINLRLANAEEVRFPFKKKLMLNNLGLAASDIPMKDLYGTALGNSLHKLSLAGNRLGSIPAKLVQSLPVLKSLDLSQCELHQLPDQWNLPKLTILILSHNRFTEFPDETMLEGLPELQQLIMYGNKVAEINIPDNPKLLSKLETLDLGYNDLVWLPEDLDQLKSLRVLKLMNNFLARVPMRVCNMDLKVIDVSSNPVIEPPIETCERGICSMRRYWPYIRMEEQSKANTLMEVQKKLQLPQRSYGRFMSSLRPKSAGTATTSPPLGSHKTSLTATSVVSTSPTSSSLSRKPRLQIKPPEFATVPKPEPVKHSVSAPIAVAEPLHGATSAAKRYELKESEVSSEGGSDSMISLGEIPLDKVTVNNTLKVMFVGMTMVGKTSMINRLIEGKNAKVPTRDERTVGVDIYDWEPKIDKRFENIDSHFVFLGNELAEACGDVEVKFSVWDFAGQHIYHATHELFFSSRSLYVLVWDMGATNPATLRQKVSRVSGETGAFRLYDSSDEGDEKDDETDLAAEEEERRVDRALEHDIDEKVQFWVDCIQSTVPGAAILPVASFNDFFIERAGGEAEAKRRCNMLKQRLHMHEAQRVTCIKERLQDYYDQNRADDLAAVQLRKLLWSDTRPKLIFGGDNDSVVRVSGTRYTGFDELTERIISIGIGRDKWEWR